MYIWFNRSRPCSNSPARRTNRQWMNVGCEDGEGVSDSEQVVLEQVILEQVVLEKGEIQFVVREQGAENAMTSTEISAVKRYYKMNRAQLTLRLTLQPKDEIKRDVFFLAMYEDKIVGFCQVVLYERSWYIWNLMRRRRYLQASNTKEHAIKKLTKGRYGGTPVNLRGVGGQLLQHAEDFVRGEVDPGTKLHLEIKSKYARVLQPYYEKYGYTCRDCDAWWHMNVFHFEKQL